MTCKRISVVLLSALCVISICGCGNGGKDSANYKANQQITIKEPTYNSLDEYRKPKDEISEVNNNSEVSSTEEEQSSEDKNDVTAESKVADTSQPAVESAAQTGQDLAEPEVNQAQAATPAASDEQNNAEQYTGEYIANKNTKKFHKQTCGSVKRMKAENIYKTANRQELTDAGYSPCARCKP